jgi:hypothetical protein
MTKVFLNLIEDGQTLKDEEGAEFKDLADAKREAEKSLHEMLGEDVRQERPLVPRSIDIVSEAGTVLASVVLEGKVDMHQITKA